MSNKDGVKSLSENTFPPTGQRPLRLNRLAISIVAALGNHCAVYSGVLTGSRFSLFSGYSRRHESTDGFKKGDIQRMHVVIGMR